MVSKWERLFIVTIVLVNVAIEGCFSLSPSTKFSFNSAISKENQNNEQHLDIIRNETFETLKRKISKKNYGSLQEVARKKSGSSSNEESMMDKILPALIIPFLISSSMIPAMLLSIKFLMIKSAIIGKIAVILMLLSFFRRRMDGGGVYNHYPVDLMGEHYGYQGVEEPGVYINKKRRKRQLS